MNFKLNKSELVYKGIVFDLKVDNIDYNSGNKSIREVAVHPGGSVIIPITDERKIILVKQYRYPFNKTLIEAPAGKLETGEEPYYCAVRELEEETGYTSDKVEKIGEICTAPGYCTEILHIYSATDLKKGMHKREEGEEGMEIMELTLIEVEEKIKRGEIIDGKTICAVYYLKNKLGFQ